MAMHCRRAKARRRLRFLREPERIFVAFEPRNRKLGQSVRAHRNFPRFLNHLVQASEEPWAADQRATEDQAMIASFTDCALVFSFVVVIRAPAVLSQGPHRYIYFPMLVMLTIRRFSRKGHRRPVKFSQTVSPSSW
jgi:hypothetical protein